MSEANDLNAEHATTAAQINADVGVEHVADVYAKGLLGATENAGLTETVLGGLDELVAALGQFPKLENILASALVSHDEKSAMLDRVFGGRVAPLVVDFLKVVSRHGRLDCLRVIHRQARLLYDELRGRVHVDLATATPVPAALADRLAVSLGAALGGEAVVRQVVDPDLIGGAVVRVGDTVYDGSIANQLKIVRQQMIDRSVHEIQSRRDRFRHSAGN